MARFLAATAGQEGIGAPEGVTAGSPPLRPAPAGCRSAGIETAGSVLGAPTGEVADLGVEHPADNYGDAPRRAGRW
jgi:hypothetical protein